MEQAVNQTRQAGSDALMLGLLLEWHYPDTWRSMRKEWTDYYRHEIDIDVETDFRIADIGSEQ